MKSINLVSALIFTISIAANAQISQQWASRYDFSGNTDKCNAMTVDASGNVYITGSSRSGGAFTEDIATNKYNPSGTLLWSKRFAGTGFGEDHGFAIACDGSGNVYVTGRTWTGTAGNNDIVTIKYNSAGDSVWVKKYNGSGSNHDEAFAIALDAAGNVYVTGSQHGTIGPNGVFDDLVVVKYSSAGSQLWAFVYNGPSGGLDVGRSIAVDGTGNVYVSGMSWGGSGSAGSKYDGIVIKLNSAGVFQWLNRENGSGNSDDDFTALKLDISANVYVTGFTSSASQGENYRTIKYNSSGSLQWSSEYNGPGNNIDEAYSIAVDRTGNVYVTGKSDGGASTAYDMTTVKYNSLGVHQWTQRFNGSSSGNDEGKSITVDTASNVYVTGYSTNTTTAGDFETIKYNSIGVQQWEIKYTNSGSAGSDDEAASIYADNAGNIYAAGMSALDYAVVKYSLVTEAGATSNEIPNGFSLSQNYPNPFNPSTKIRFSVPVGTGRNLSVKLNIYDALGSLVQTLVDDDLEAGDHEVNFNASGFASGIYFYKLMTSDFTDVKKMILIK